MPARALAEKRPWLLASLIAGISYWFADHAAVPGLWLIAWKGAGVGLLAAYAIAHHPSRDAHRIALVMALGALGDMLLELAFTVGAVFFLLGHLAAFALYRRYRRTDLGMRDQLPALAILWGTPLLAYGLSHSGAVALYAAGLGLMAASAWNSTFPRDRVALGALLFAASDELIFARMGPLAGNALAQALVWPLYYFGQMLICTGVIATLRARGQFTAE
ncbi:lysoplasmalogenase family protein [Novosphingobium sp.]|uniref:lysoplasmalogenase family protein n=1 Tax=Novosphingobium sp. TaxID=1874826 RepID=UPI0038B9FA2D